MLVRASYLRIGCADTLRGCRRGLVCPFPRTLVLQLKEGEFQIHKADGTFGLTVGDCAAGFQRHVDPFGVEAEVDGLADIWLAGGHGEDLTGLPVSKFAWIVYAERL